jgi:hypothetical protein
MVAKEASRDVLVHLNLSLPSLRVTSSWLTPEAYAANLRTALQN